MTQSAAELNMTPTRPSLSLVMTNLARVSKASVVIDPFSGRGGMIAGARHVGAFVLGADLLPQEPRGDVTTGGRGAWCDVVVSDVFRSIWRTGGRENPTSTRAVATDSDSGASTTPRSETGSTGNGNCNDDSGFGGGSSSGGSGGGWCDAVITDPPYGLRERRTGADTGLVYDDDGSGGAAHAVDEDGYSVRGKCFISDYTGEELLERVSEMMAPVLELSVDVLVPGGRLVYLLPVFPAQDHLGLWYRGREEDGGSAGGDEGGGGGGGGDSSVRSSCSVSSSSGYGSSSSAVGSIAGGDLEDEAAMALPGQGLGRAARSLLPAHPLLKLVSCTWQSCVSKGMARVVVTMERR